MERVEKYYDEGYDEWSRLDCHRIEFEMTRRTLDRYIQGAQKILDVGGGPGRYSIYLAGRGHLVTLVDLSARHVVQAIEKAEEAGVSLQSALKGNVLQLDQLLSETYDTVLCMGPMYHLLEEEERIRAIDQCIQRLKPGGLLMVSFISAYAPIVDGMKRFPEGVADEKAAMLGYLKDGRHDTQRAQGFTDAYFMNPDNIAPFMARFPLKPVKIMAVEGLAALLEERLMQLSEDQFLNWIDILEAICEHPAIFGCCEHLLYVGEKL